MAEDNGDFDPDLEAASEISDGSWRQERKFVLSQLKMHERGIHKIRNLVNAMNLAYIDQMHKFDIKLTKVTIYQTIVIAVIVFAIKWLFKV